MNDPVAKLMFRVQSDLAAIIKEEAGSDPQKIFDRTMKEFVAPVMLAAYELGFCIYAKLEEAASKKRNLTPEETEACWNRAQSNFAVERRLASRDTAEEPAAAPSTDALDSLMAELKNILGPRI